MNKCRKAAHAWYEEKDLATDPWYEKKKETRRQQIQQSKKNDKEALFESWKHEAGMIRIIVDNETVAETLNGHSVLKDKRLTIICKENFKNLEKE